MADVNYMMKGIERAMERQKKQAALSAPAPVTPKAPVVAPKKEEQPELKSNLTQEEIDYYVALLWPHRKTAEDTTTRILKEKLRAMGLEPVKP